LPDIVRELQSYEEEEESYRTRPARREAPQVLLALCRGRNPFQIILYQVVLLNVAFSRQELMMTDKYARDRGRRGRRAQQEEEEEEEGRGMTTNLVSVAWWQSKSRWTDTTTMWSRATARR
jgi:hypothetical protein